MKKPLTLDIENIYVQNTIGRNLHSQLTTHILNNRYQYGTTENVTDVIKHTGKGQWMNIKENFYTCIHEKLNLLIDDNNDETMSTSSAQYVHQMAK
jgi:hypothetical protein